VSRRALEKQVSVAAVRLASCEATKVHFEKQPTEQPSVLSSRTLDTDDMTEGTVDVRRLGNVQERGLKKILASSQ